MKFTLTDFPVPYHRGFLMTDRAKGDGHEAVAEVAREAWAAYEAGDAVLFQRRHGTDDYEYFAVRHKAPKPRQRHYTSRFELTDPNPKLTELVL